MRKNCTSDCKMKHLKTLLSGLMAAIMVCCMLIPAAVLAEAQPDASQPVTSTHPDDPMAAFRMRQDKVMFEIDNEGHPISWRKVRSLHMLSADGKAYALYRGQTEQPWDTVIQTGDQIVMLDAIESVAHTVVVKADPLSTGSVDVAQLVRTAMALQGTAPLTGAELAAADINNSQSVDIVDLVSMARYLVNHSISAGPFDDLPAWTEGLEVPEPSADPTPVPSDAEPSGLPEPDETPTPAGDASDAPEMSAEPTDAASTDPEPSEDPDMTAEPSDAETPEPSETAAPTAVPSDKPTDQPSALPTEQPSAQPTERPSASPSRTPLPSTKPSATHRPSVSPSRTSQPSAVPTAEPSETAAPTAPPSESPQPSLTASPSASVQPSATLPPQPSISADIQPPDEPQSSALPDTSGDSWNGSNAEDFVEALERQMRDMRFAGSAKDRSISFSDELRGVARDILEGEHAATPEELAAQTAQTGEDGIIRFVLAVYPDKLEQNAAGRIPMHEMVAAVVGAEAHTQCEGTRTLWDTLLHAERLGAGLAVSRFHEEGNRTALDTVYVAVAMEPQGSEPLWNSFRTDDLAKAVGAQLAAMRADGAESESPLEFDVSLAERAAECDQRDGLEQQTGLVGEDGVIDFVSAVYLERLAPNGNMQLIPLPDVVRAVTGPDAHTNPQGKAVLWDTLQRAEYVEAGIAAASGGPDEPGTVYVTIALRPAADETLWNPHRPQELVEAVRSGLQERESLYAGQERTVRLDKELTQIAAVALNRHDLQRLPAQLQTQSGDFGTDGLISFVLPFYPDRLAQEADYNLITVSEAAQALVGPAALRHLKADGATLLFRILDLAERIDVGAAVSGVTDAGPDGEAVVFLQLVARPSITVPLWDENDLPAYEEAIMRALQEYYKDLKPLEEATGAESAAGRISLKNPSRALIRRYLTMEDMVGEALLQAAEALHACTSAANGDTVIQWDKFLGDGFEVGISVSMAGDDVRIEINWRNPLE